MALNISYTNTSETGYVTLEIRVEVPSPTITREQAQEIIGILATSDLVTQHVGTEPNTVNATAYFTNLTEEIPYPPV